ncbi:MAG: transposase [Candidatus Levyibacteriota bacterium]
MPGRNTILANGETYHIFNRGVASQPTFIDKKDYQRVMDSFFYYQNITPPIKYSKFLMISAKERDNIINNLRKKKFFHADIIAYCFMPTHFHLLLRQNEENGISKFVGNFTNSYTRYFNTKRERKGPIFEGKFGSVRIETSEQLLHVSRYIHLNPYSSYLVKTTQELESFTYSSFNEYIAGNSNLCNKDFILENFKTAKEYKKFVFDQADYQKKLNNIKHLLLEN